MHQKSAIALESNGVDLPRNSNLTFSVEFRSIKTYSKRAELLREPAVRAYEFAKAIWTKANDTRLGIRTMPKRFRVRKLSVDDLNALHSDKVNGYFDDGAGYESPDYINLKKVISIVRPGPTDIVYDLGCGMGRVLCLFARQGVSGSSCSPNSAKSRVGMLIVCVENEVP